MRLGKFNLFRILMVFSFLLPFMPGDAVHAQPVTQLSTPGQKAQAILNQMTPEERVGQVFVVTFNGTNVGKDSKIYDLINKHHIGGVVLKTANDNFTDADTNLQDIKQMNTNLQQDAWATSHVGANQTYAPLLIGLSQEGNLYPNDQIFSGLTPLPDLMAIGATWKPNLAENVGKVMGQELNALGFNLYLGPSLDVLDVNMLEGEDLATRSFGGNAYWVGELGKAYIKGLHEGSSNQMAVIAKNFPGRGGSDRQPEEDVATVRKPLTQLTQVDLAPFANVASSSSNPSMTSDGFLISNIRYQGYQGNILATTKPISFDQTAIDQLMAMSPFTQWRSAGGIIMTDDLGSSAIKKFFDPTGKSFDARQVARIALQAGNDLLYMDNITATGDADKYVTVGRTMDYFVQKYREDPAFAKRIDTSALRVLTLKYKLYDDFNIQRVLNSGSSLNEVGKSSQVSFEVAQSGATLINPTLTDLNSTLPHSPASNDKLVFFTDNTPFKTCSTCKEQSSIAVDAMQRAVIKLYGPQSGAQVLQYRLSSYSFGDLLNYLNATNPSPTLEDDIRSANWLVFATTNVSKDRPASLALKRFLSEHAQLLQDKKIIVFAMDAPYYLDATDISKITAYYGLYSKTPSFIEAAVRILFQELVPAGALPVSVSATGYDLDMATSPDPNQIIPLSVDMDVYQGQHPLPTGTATTQPESTPTAEATKVPLFKAGDTIPLVTGQILDHNRNPVPDGTIARFVFVTGSEAGASQQIEAPTKGGLARAVYRIQSPGFMEIRVTSEQANLSEILRLDITNNQAVAVTAIAPTMIPTLPTQTTETLTPTPTVTPTVQPKNTSTSPNFGDWLFSILIITVVAIGIYDTGRRRISLRWGVRWGFMTAIGGLLGYLLVMILDRGKGWGDDPFQYFGYIFMGMLIGWAVSWIWQKIE